MLWAAWQSYSKYHVSVQHSAQVCNDVQTRSTPDFHVADTEIDWKAYMQQVQSFVQVTRSSKALQIRLLLLW